MSAATLERPSKTSERESTSEPEAAYVVLSQHMGQWERGRVIRPSMFPAGFSLQSHMRRGNLRPATSVEATQERVQLGKDDEVNRNVSLEEENSRDKTLISQLRSEITAKDAQIAQLQATPPVAPEIVAKQEEAFRSLIADKDRVINDLNATITNKDQEIAQLNERIREQKESRPRR